MKLVYHYLPKNNQHYELFNLESDPYEQKNLADTDKETLQKMLTSMKTELDKNEALYPVKAWQSYPHRRSY